MPKVIWKGGIIFGLVYIPVKLYSGTSQHDLDLHMLRKVDQCPITEGTDRMNFRQDCLMKPDTSCPVITPIYLGYGRLLDGKRSIAGGAT